MPNDSNELPQDDESNEQDGEPIVDPQDGATKSAKDDIISEFPEVDHDIVELIMKRSVEFSGPLPPPSLLQGYEDITTGSASRIIAMAEQEQKHRHHMDEYRDGNQFGLQNKGLNFGFTISLTVTIGGIALLLLGQPAVGIALVVGPAVTIGGLFLRKDRQNREQNEQKALPSESSTSED
jgi:uncharacterized membrane protein